MIELHRLDNSRLFINDDQIESIEEVPDTIVTLSNGKKMVTKEKPRDIFEKIIDSKMITLPEGKRVMPRLGG